MNFVSQQPDSTKTAVMKRLSCSGTSWSYQRGSAVHTWKQGRKYTQSHQQLQVTKVEVNVSIINSTIRHLIINTHSKTSADVKTDLLPVQIIPETLAQPVLADLNEKNDQKNRTRTEQFRQHCI